MRLITFSDYDGREVSVRADLIESVHLPTTRVHDHGGLMLTTGRRYEFDNDGTAARILVELERSPLDA